MSLKVARNNYYFELWLMETLLQVLQNQEFPVCSLTPLAVFHTLALQLHWQWFPHAAYESQSRFSSSFSRLHIQVRPTAVTMMLKNPAKGLGLQKNLNQFIFFSARFRRESRVMLTALSLEDAMKSALSGESWVWEAASPPCCAKCLCEVKGTIRYWCLMGLKLLS